MSQDQIYDQSITEQKIYQFWYQYFWRGVHGLGTCGGDPSVAVAAFLSFLGRVQLSDAGLSVSAACGKEDSRLFHYFIKLIFH